MVVSKGEVGSEVSQISAVFQLFIHKMKINKIPQMRRMLKSFAKDMRDGVLEETIGMP